MANHPHIDRYHEHLNELREFGGYSEMHLRFAFQNCLDSYCRDHQEKLILVPELALPSGLQPDGTVKDSLRMARGYWEAKDTGDDLDTEIQRKFDKGYPRDNIVFEDTETAVLVQNGEVAMRVDMRRPDDLHRLISHFLDYELPQIEEFKRAQEEFKADLPTILNNLRSTIEDAEGNNSLYREGLKRFLQLCRRTIGLMVSKADVREMLLQHILTQDIFLRVFGEDQFHRENNIARQLKALEDTFFFGTVRREAVDRLRTYYGVIGRAADDIADFAEKQGFLKAIYEDFYKVYNPAAADYLGVVYTPNEVVDFMIRGTDYLLHTYFGRGLGDRNVQILDPATGTGTFVTNLINYLPEEQLKHKYLYEIHANEVAILPYYIANLNIEYTYKEKTGHYLEFPNLCFVDTLDNMGWQQTGATGGAVERQGMFDLGALSEENWIRVQEQNEKTISVIIGNPPYNDSAVRWGDGTENRGYFDIDRRIKETYVDNSAAQKTHQYDMYKRFLRWASDRLADDGVIAFITNRAYLDAFQDDGFRKITAQEFNEMYILDLGSDVRRNPKISGTTHNVFGIQTGVAIGFFVRDSRKIGECNIHYSRREDAELAKDKLAFLNVVDLKDIPFETIWSDARHHWFDHTNNDFETLLSVAKHKRSPLKRSGGKGFVFGFSCNAAKSNRDEWVYDFDPQKLLDKTQFFEATYNSFFESNENLYDSVIKWSRDLRNEFLRGRRISLRQDEYIRALYRPYTFKSHAANFVMNDVLTNNHYKLLGSDLRHFNRVICFSGKASSKAFQALAVDHLPCFDALEKTVCLPLYCYGEDGNRVSNITEYGLQQFRDHYGDQSISAEEIFAYTYAVLHDPEYREKYAVDLLREFPRLPFYSDFRAWADIGQELLNSHIGFESAEPFPLYRRDAKAKPGKPRLKADKERGLIILDGQTTLSGVPDVAWEYVLGSRSALEWVLDQ